MKVILQAQAQFELKVTKAHIEVLVLYASRHYDATCRSTTLPKRNNQGPFEGLLSGWSNTLDFWDAAGSPEKAYVTADDSQIDILQKCMEFTQPGTTPEQELLRHELQRVFRDCRRHWRTLYEQWRAEWNLPEPTKG
jgi:hypothetical protein